MRFKNIRISFYIALLSVIFVRFLQFFHSIDSVTGFIKPGYKLIGYGLLALTFLITVTIMCIGFSIKRCPVKMPRINLVAGCSALVLAFAILYDIALVGTSASIPTWQTLLLKITGALTAVFFGALFVKSTKKIKNFSVPTICFVVPVIYYLVRLIYIFTASSVIALISDNLLSLATCIFTLLFMFEFCIIKFKNEGETSYKKVAAIGFAAVILSAATAVPHVIAVFCHVPHSQRVDLPEAVLTLCSGLFIYLFLRNYFSGRNLKKPRRKHRSKKGSSVGKATDSFYIG